MSVWLNLSKRPQVTPSAVPATLHPSISLISMLKHAAHSEGGELVGRLEDAVALLRDDEYPMLTGLIVCVGGRPVFVPIADALEINPLGAHRVRVTPGVRPFDRRDGEALLKAEVLGRRLVDLPRGVLVTAQDIRFAVSPEGWRAVGVDVHKHSWLHFGSHETHPARDWCDFLLLTTDHAWPKLPRSISRIGRLKPAQIADIIERAPAKEQGVLLALVHEDPNLEANVFEELEDDQQAQLLKSRTDADVADVLARMRADDAADAIMELPQDRRQSVLDHLPQLQKTKVRTLLGYNQATAGGLMGTEFLALSENCSIADALNQLRGATTQQPEALVTIHSLHADETLAGTLSLVRALQLQPATLLRDAADAGTVVASPDDDIIAVTTRMADFNLLTLPVVDASGRLIGVVTVDDALEAAIPRDWSRREAGRASTPKSLAG
jgi:CBS domain-containing protein